MSRAKRPAGRPFQPGPDPRRAPGRVPGQRNRATVAALEAIARHAEELVTVALKLARGGDVAALRLLLDRVLPAMRDRAVELELPALRSPADVPEALAAVLRAVAAGAVTPGEGGRLAELLGKWGEAHEGAALAARVEELEAKLAAALDPRCPL